MDTAQADVPRRYLITGGTSGIGRACAAHLTAAGHRVWITGTRQESLSPALEAGVAAGGSVAEARDASALTSAFAAAHDAFGGVDAAFLNAGIDGEAKPAQDLDPEHFRRVLDVNVVGALIGAQAAREWLVRPGTLVINASVNAVRPEPGFADYNASKAAAEALAKSLALDWAGDGLSVMAVCPGYFRSRMTAGYMDDPAVGPELLAHIPMGRYGRPEEIGALLEFLLSGRAAFMSGASIPIAGAANV
ncbi:SDR family oxidoreductase [Brevibacterium sp. 5221]|uniref:SDR family oxidoreductase n=1 Tax=Brevibacterium rongguiense TaxID=2695267 RepID=A0A6N9H5J0_9MICO|nr:SDR family oxidoreductase [Brevibacterium rongguiense]MYM19310.1 SDR family oxidoreductase [Brevibacterium rongguiense]